MRVGEMQWMKPRLGTIGVGRRAPMVAEKKPEPAKWVAADWGAIQREANKIRRRAIPALLLLGMMLMAGCVRPSSGKVFSVSCYSGGQRIWAAGDVTQFDGNARWYFDSAAQGSVSVSGDCVVLEVDE